jgi:hypothetical protein
MDTGYEPVVAKGHDRSTKKFRPQTQKNQRFLKHFLFFGSGGGGYLHTPLGAEPFANAHERLAKLVQAGASAVAPKRVARLDVDEFGGVRSEEQRAQFAMLAEL